MGSMGVLAQEASSDALDPDVVQAVILGLIAVCVVGMIAVVRSVQKMTTRGILLVLLFAVGGLLWTQRQELKDCRDTCTCNLFGLDVKIPDDQAPTYCR